MSRLAFNLAFETPFGSLLPSRVKNVIYRQYIDQLRRQAIAAVQPDCIFETQPVHCDRTSVYKVWMLTSAQDTTMAFWALKSLLHYSEVPWDIWLADGGLRTHHLHLFEQHFPSIRIQRHNDLDERARGVLRSFPLSYQLRHQRGYAPAMKLFDPPLYLSERFLLLDSDVLFFSKPEEILVALNDSNVPFYFNMELGAINSGVSVVDPQAVRLEDVELCLSTFSQKQLNGWTIEQDVYASLAKDRFAPLPARYAVEPIAEAEHGRVTCCHYIGVCRHLFFRHGIARLRSQNFLGLQVVN